MSRSCGIWCDILLKKRQPNKIFKPKLSMDLESSFYLTFVKLLNILIKPLQFHNVVSSLRTLNVQYKLEMVMNT